MTRRLLTIATAAAVVCLAACGGSSSNGEASKSASAILADARQAADDAGSVTVSGRITDSGQTIGLHLSIGRDGGSGSMTIQGSKVDIVRIGKTVYLRAPASFYTAVGAGAAAGQLLDGKWLKASAAGKDFADLAKLTEVDTFVARALKPDGTVSKGSETTVKGQKVIELKDSKGGSLYVATTGKPYPVELEGTGSQSGTLELTDWGAAVKPTAPKGAIDLAKLGG